MLKTAEISSPLRAEQFGLLNHAVIKVHVISVANSLSVLAIQSPPFKTHFTTIWERGQSKQKQRKIGESDSHKMLIKITKGGGKMPTLEEAESYSKVLADELEHAKLRLSLSEKEGKRIIKPQIREIKGDIRRNSMKIKDVNRQKSLYV